MGWNNYARFGWTTDCVKHPNDCIDEELFMQQADRLGNYPNNDIIKIYTF
jgi:hypothetical protein